MKTIILLLVLALPLTSFGQTLKEAKKVLKKLHFLEQLDELKSNYPNWTIYEDITMQSDSSKFPDIVNGKIGDIVLKQYNPKAPTFVIKILAEREIQLCKIKYIYLDGSKLTAAQVDSLRKIILSRYNSGDEFQSLVTTFTMDGNPTGDLDWFYKGMMDEEFDNAVRSRKKDEIFEVDVARKKWYYVVLKTHDNKMEKAKISIVIKYGI